MRTVNGDIGCLRSHADNKGKMPDAAEKAVLSVNRRAHGRRMTGLIGMTKIRLGKWGKRWLGASDGFRSYWPVSRAAASRAK